MKAALSQYRPANAEPIMIKEYETRVTRLLQSFSNDGFLEHSRRDKQLLEVEDTLHGFDDSLGNIATSFLHHLIWRFGLLTGVRNASLCPAPGSGYTEILAEGQTADELCWGDLEITRDTFDPSRLIAQITFRQLNGRTYDAHPKGAVLEQVIKSPEDTQYLALSIPLHLVVLALRNGYPKDHQSIDSVLHGDDHTNQLKATCKNYFVFPTIPSTAMTLYL